MLKLDVTVLCLGLGLSVTGCSSSGLQTQTLDRKVDCGGACAFTATYTVGTVGYFATNADSAVLSPSQGYQHIAQVFTDASPPVQTRTCAPAIPSCADGGTSISPCDIAQDLADPVVQAALAQSSPPFFAPDTRGTDGNAFSFKRDDGHGFLVGEGTCATGDKSCVPVPPAIARLKADLQTLDAAMILTPECTALGLQLRIAGNG